MKRTFEFGKGDADFGKLLEVFRQMSAAGTHPKSAVKVVCYMNGQVRRIEFEEYISPVAGEKVEYPNQSPPDSKVSYINGSPIQHPSFQEPRRDA